MLLAGLDGVQNKIEPPEPLEMDLFDLPAEELAQIAHTPGSLEEALDALEADNEFLRVGGVFTDDLIDTWIDYKRLEEADPSGCGPTPGSSRSTTTSDRRRRRRSDVACAGGVGGGCGAAAGLGLGQTGLLVDTEEVAGRVEERRQDLATRTAPAGSTISPPAATTAAAVVWASATMM